jgi:hypothetical protein
MQNEKYFISVSEPWNFENVDGRNIIEGKILNIKSNKCLVFKSNYNLKFDNVSGDILILFPRYKENNFSDMKRRIDINGGLLLETYIENFSEKELENKSKFVIIGSIRKD